MKILVTRKLPSIAVDLLSKAGLTVTVGERDHLMTRDELITQGKQHDAIICTLTEKIDKEFLTECSHLKFISQFGVGYDNIDVAEATRLKIPVGNTPGVLTEATADIAFGLMLATARKFMHCHKSILKGEWGYFQPLRYLGVELKGKTLGIFGMGRIGLEMAKRCVGAYGMKVIYNNRNRNATSEKEISATWVSFDDLLAGSDILSVHSALTPETKGVFDRTAFAKMKPTSIFINTARGGIHNEEDLLAALQSGKIWGAGLDVTNPEPTDKNNPLLNMEQVVVLPHIGSATLEARTAMARLAATNLVEFFTKGRAPHQVNL